MTTRHCDWAYEINLPLECFLNGSKPDLGTPWVMWLLPMAFVAIGGVIEYFRRDK